MMLRKSLAMSAFLSGYMIRLQLICKYLIPFHSKKSQITAIQLKLLASVDLDQRHLLLDFQPYFIFGCSYGIKAFTDSPRNFIGEDGRGPELVETASATADATLPDSVPTPSPWSSVAEEDLERYPPALEWIADNP